MCLVTDLKYKIVKLGWEKHYVKIAIEDINVVKILMKIGSRYYRTLKNPENFTVSDIVPENGIIASNERISFKIINDGKRIKFNGYIGLQINKSGKHFRFRIKAINKSKEIGRLPANIIPVLAYGIIPKGTKYIKSDITDINNDICSEKVILDLNNTVELCTLI